MSFEMKNFYISLFLLLTGIEQISAQTLVQSFPFSRYTPYDYPRFFNREEYNKF